MSYDTTEENKTRVMIGAREWLALMTEARERGIKVEGFDWDAPHPLYVTADEVLSMHWPQHTIGSEIVDGRRGRVTEKLVDAYERRGDRPPAHVQKIMDMKLAMGLYMRDNKNTSATS